MSSDLPVQLVDKEEVISNTKLNIVSNNTNNQNDANVVVTDDINEKKNLNPNKYENSENIDGNNMFDTDVSVLDNDTNNSAAELSESPEPSEVKKSQNTNENEEEDEEPTCRICKVSVLILLTYCTNIPYYFHRTILQY